MAIVDDCSAQIILAMTLFEEDRVADGGDGDIV